MSPFLRHRIDALPILVCVGFPVSLVLTALAFDGLGAWARVGAFLALAVTWQSGSYAYHHHNHLSFFRRDWANRAFEVICSAGWRIPVSREATYHFIHHVPGLLRSRDAQYRGGLRAALDHCGFTSPRIFLANAFDVLGLRWLVGVLLLSKQGYDIVPVVRTAEADEAERSVFSWHPVRGNFWGWVGSARRRGQLGHITRESVAIVLFQLTLLAISPTFYAAYCVLHVVSYALYDLQDFCEHTRNDLRYDETVSASCYGTLYNWWLFNGGHHMEHHARPGTHWAKLPQVRRELAEKGYHRVVPLSMYLSPFVARTRFVRPELPVRLAAAAALDEAGGRLAVRDAFGELHVVPEALAPAVRRLAETRDFVAPQALAEHTGASDAALLPLLEALRTGGALDLGHRRSGPEAEAFPDWANYPYLNVAGRVARRASEGRDPDAGALEVSPST